MLRQCSMFFSFLSQYVLLFQPFTLPTCSNMRRFLPCVSLFSQPAILFFSFLAFFLNFSSPNLCFLIINLTVFFFFVYFLCVWIFFSISSSHFLLLSSLLWFFYPSIIFLFLLFSFVNSFDHLLSFWHSVLFICLDYWCFSFSYNWF